MTHISSVEQLRQFKIRGQEIIENPEILINLFQEINIVEIDFNTIEPGSYRSLEPPTLEFFAKMPYYKNGEIGVVCFNDVWFITFSEADQLEVPFPLDIKILKYLNALQYHIHSHPANDLTKTFSHLPSDIDLNFCNSTINNTQYIVSEHGLTVLNVDQNGIDYRNRFMNWALYDLGLDKDEFISQSFRLIERFCVNNLNYRLIPWHEVKEFMNSKEFGIKSNPHK